MKVVAFNGSARKKGNTQLLIDHVFRELTTRGIDTETVSLAGRPMRGCLACLKCFTSQDKRCAVDVDFVNECVEKMLGADAIILASPTYFANVSAEMKALIDRAGMVAKANGDMLARKVGASVVAVRRGGAIQVFNALNAFFLIGQMVVVGSSYWNMGIGLNRGDVDDDAEGVQTMQTLGRNMAWALERLRG
ncbi:flavodoxin family protein [Desulfocurvus vexinensis]|uniref:flavodoxin family protein n=1 Tax=Desulfocurvus vexinensis TaxID=399548 RepID=UPI000490B556|nr:flavodoxin family protein [Desulfocurvus vexinensis]